MRTSGRAVLAPCRPRLPRVQRCAHAASQTTRQFSFAYDQPTTTAYGIAATLFEVKLKEVSGGKLAINQFPGGQLGQEPQMLQKLRAGDIDFVVTSTANASTLTPQAGVFSLHFIRRPAAASPHRNGRSNS